MQRHGEEVELTEQEASGAIKPHVLRYMLATSLLLALVKLMSSGAKPQSSPSTRDEGCWTISSLHHIR